MFYQAFSILENAKLHFDVINSIVNRINSLPAKQVKIAIALRYDGLTIEKAATRLGITVDSVRVQFGLTMSGISPKALSFGMDNK